MVQKWLNTDYAKPAGGTGFGAAGARWGNGIDTAVTHYYGTTDPSSGASWGADQLGIIWFDSNNVLGNGGDDLGLVVKRWEKLDSTPTYGWRTLYIRSYVPLEPNVNKLDLTNQGDVAWTDCDVTSETSARAIAVLLAVTVLEAVPGATFYASFRKNGQEADAQERRVYPQVSGIPTTHLVMVELDEDQVFEYAIAANGADTFSLRADILGYWERG